MKYAKPLNAVLACSALLVVLAGCQKQEGPAEKIGKEVDQAATKVGQQVEKAGEKIKDVAEDAKR